METLVSNRIALTMAALPFSQPRTHKGMLNTMRGCGTHAAGQKNGAVPEGFGA